MEALFIIIAIAVAAMNYSQKQNRNQKKAQSDMKGLTGMKKDHARHLMKNRLEDMQNTEAEHQPGSKLYYEGDEGFSTKHPEHMHMEKRGGKTAPAAAAMEGEEDNILDLTGESLLRSVVMAEILGLPRALKRNIR